MRCSSCLLSGLANRSEYFSHSQTEKRDKCIGYTMILVLAIFAAALGMFQFGYNTSVINQPQKYIEAFINESYAERGIEYPTTDSEITTLFRSVSNL